MEEGLLVSQTQKRKKNRKQSQSPSCSQSQSQIWSHSPSASPSPFPPRTHNRTAHSSNHHSSSYTQPHTHSHYSHNSNHHHSNSCLNRRKATGLAKRKAKKGLSPNRRKKRADRRAPVLKRKIPVLWSRGSSLHRDRDRLWGSHTAFSLESSRDSSRETPTDETPCWAGEQRFLGRTEAVTPGGQCRPMERPSEASQSRGSTWKGLLIITASILSCWSQPTSAQDLTVVPDPVYGRVGDTVTLNVLEYSGRALGYNWYYKSSAQDPDLTLLIQHNVQDGKLIPEDTRQKILTGGAQLTVYARPPKPTIISSNMAPVENKDTVSLACQAEGQILTYRWFMNESAPTGERIQLSLDNKTLTIKNITREDKGPYVCEIRIPVSMSDPFTVNVTYGPDTPMIVHTVDRFSIGAYIEFICSAESNPPAQFTWFQNGQKLSNSATLSTTVSLNHTGTYTCHASNSYTGLNSSKDKNIAIYEKLMKPNITINSTGIIMENETVVLMCNTENKDLPDIWWYFQNKKLILNDRMTLSQNNQTLTIMSMKREDNGAYQCKVWNPVFANISDLFNLAVIYGPEQITIFPKSVHGQIESTFNKNLTLECQASSQPLAQYTWQVNGSSISGNSGNTYTISEVSSEHAGTYTCMAMNNVTNATISTNITVRMIDKKALSLSGGPIAGIVIGVLAGVALIGALIYNLFIKISIEEYSITF
uniref:Ig-like domain-containing protein n=1 Tax=Monodelphis domestica TaxID=13616 RepID=A0A5F8HIC9_MONDO